MILAIISGFVVFATEEGAAVSETVADLGSAVFTVLRFPTHMLFEHFVNISGWLYFGGIGVNCLIYAVCIERLASVAKKK